MPKFRADNILTSRRSIEGERKLISVLFGDVANYTSMAEKLDPEGVHQIVDGCFRILMDEIHRYERTIVAQFEPGDLKKRPCSRYTHQQETPGACWHIELSSR